MNEMECCVCGRVAPHKCNSHEEECKLTSVDGGIMICELLGKNLREGWTEKWGQEVGTGTYKCLFFCPTHNIINCPSN